MISEMTTGNNMTSKETMTDGHYTKTDQKYKDHRMMSLSEITNKLHEDFSDEIEGANLYLDMANSAMHMHHCDLADILCAMANDEFSHARFIHCFLKESGIHVSEDIHKEWEELESRFHKAFCETKY